jgi:hypothetical protein
LGRTLATGSFAMAAASSPACANQRLNNNSNIAINAPPAATPSVPQNSGTSVVKPPSESLPPDAGAERGAIDVVHRYYDEINTRNFRKAYELWAGHGEASGQSFEAFRDGFAETESVTIDTGGKPADLEGAAGSQYATVPIRIMARTKEGAEQNFEGEYVLRRSMVDGATAEQRSWRIYSAEIAPSK